MSSSTSEVYDLFLQTCTDYRLLELFKVSEDDFSTYLEAWLQFAINDFSSICDQSLEFDEITKDFPVVLSRENKIVLATLMMKYWLQKNVNDITQMNLHVTDRDFKVPSEALNLREKVKHLNIVQEQCSQLLNDYAYKRIEWSDWFAQDFEGA